MSNIVSRNTLGLLNVSETVITKIVAKSVLEVKGVECIGTTRRFSPVNLIRFFVTDTSPIFFKNKGGVLYITVNISVNSESTAAKIAKLIQINVKQDVQNMTGLIVENVTVNIVGFF